MSRKVIFGSILFIFVGCILFFIVRFGNVPPLIKFAAKALLSFGTMGVLMSLFTRWILGVRRADRLFLNLTISLITIFALFVIAEFGVRFFFRDVTTTSDNTSYFAQRWKKTIRKNHWGFRERDFDWVKPEGVYRIAVIGDSITYGQGIEEKDRFTNLLENRLDGRNGRYEVLNFGRPGAETVDHLDILHDPVLSAGPDFLLLQWYTNDVEGHDHSGRPRPLRLIPSDVLISHLREISALFYLMNNQWISIQRNLGWLPSYQEYMSARFGNPASPDSIAAKEVIQKFIDVCKKQGLTLGIVLFGDSSLDFLQERVLEFCKQEAITCLALPPYKEDPKFWASRLDPHPGSLANHLVADRLMETFGEVWLSRSEFIES